MCLLCLIPLLVQCQREMEDARICGIRIFIRKLLFVAHKYIKYIASFLYRHCMTIFPPFLTDFVIHNLLSLTAHYSCYGSACSERNPKDSASPLQELCRTHHHEDIRGSQRHSQGGYKHFSFMFFFYCHLGWAMHIK